MSKKPNLLKAISDEMDHLDDLYSRLPEKATRRAPDAYWEGAQDAQEYLFARLRNVLKEYDA